MNLEEWTRQFDEVQATITRLEQRTDTSEPQREVLREALEELRVTLEQLATTSEELRQQQDELAATCAQLEAERTRYRDLFEFAPDGYLVTDARGKIREANHAATRLLNLGARMLHGQPLLAMVVREDQSRFLDLLRRLTEGNSVRTWNLRMQCRDSVPFSAAVVAHPMADEESGTVKTIRWMVRDVTVQVVQEQALRDSKAALTEANATLEQRVAERTAELRASEERFRVVLHGSPVTVLQQDTDLRYTWVYNPHPSFNAEEMIGKAMADMMPKEDADRLDALKRCVLESGQGLREVVPVTLAGKLHWFDTRVEPLHDANGILVGVTTVGTDITEYQRAAEAQRFLGEVSSMLATSLDPDALLQHTARLVAGRLADGCAFALPANPDSDRIELRVVHHADPEQAEALYEWLDQGLHEHLEQHPFWQAMRSRQTLSLSNGTAAAGEDGPPGLEHHVPPQEQEPDPSLSLTSMLVASLVARDQVIGVMGLLNNQPWPPYTTEELQTIEELARRVALALDTTRSYATALHARAEAEHALRMRNQVFHMVSHDLRTPITTALGNVFLIKRDLGGLNLDPTTLQHTTRYAHRIEQSLNHLTNQIDEILDVARLEEGESMLLRLTPVEVPQLVRRLVEEIQQAHRAYHFHIEQQAAALTIEGDGNQLERVLGNMLSNAVKYSPAESTITVTLAAGECNDTPGVLISVRDEGVGIPSEDLPYVFEPFRRGSNVQTRTSGTGLGLASTRYVVEQHGGRVWVASDEGCGSTFTVWLPHCEGG